MAVSVGHVISAALAGALVGFLVGAIGQPLRRASLVLVILATLAALALAVRGNPEGYGLRRQVPRRWIQQYGAGRAYAAWGALLGSGVATVVPHSAYLVLLAAEFVSGPLLGALAGAAYGFAREVSAVLLARERVQAAQIAGLLPRVRGLAVRGNLVVTVIGGLALVGVYGR